MDRAQLRRCKHRRGGPRIAAHLICHAEFLQQPQDALRTAILEMVDDDHRLFRTQSAAISFTSLAASTAVTPLRSRVGLYSTMSAPTSGASIRSSTATIGRASCRERVCQNV